MSRGGLWIALVLLGGGGTVWGEATNEEFFETKVRPVLVERCYKCHSSQSAKLKGGLKLDSWEAMAKGGESGTPAVVAGKVEEGTLVKAIRYKDEDLQMPPKTKLSDEQIRDIETWVKSGANYPKTTLKLPLAGTKTAPAAVQIAPLSVSEGRNFWSLKRPAEQVVPKAGEGWARNEIDRFVYAKLAEKGLTPAPEADRRTLIRRVAYDLTGLPPTAQEVDAFCNDASNDAYEKVVDRLLASPRYGEKWGRHWLDVARYADTKGYVFEEERRYGFSYTYRDWVVRSFNEDLPYDQFLIQQIAADRLNLGEDKRPLAALGFLTLGRRFINNQHDIIDDRIDVVCRGTMGLTVACARCHDHKFDPIPTADYYSLYGVFASSREPAVLPVIGRATDAKETEAYEKELAKRTADREGYVKERQGALEKELRSAKQIKRYLLAAQKGISKEADLPFEVVDDGTALNKYNVGRWEKALRQRGKEDEGVFAAWRALAKLPAGDFGTRSAVALQRVAAEGGVNPIVLREIVGAGAPRSMDEVAGRYGELLARYDREKVYDDDPAAEGLRKVLRGEDAPTAIDPAHINGRLTQAEQAHLRQLQLQIDNLTATHPGSPPRAMAMEDGAVMTPHVFKRGNPGNLGEEVPKRFLAVLSPEKREAFKDGSGRLELARAIASKENPLTARVMVNRVWGWHFGKGIVRTPSDFGTRGERPTHPELLDWLALRFEDGWSVKKLNRMIVLSATYRQSSSQLSVPSSQWEKGVAADPENRLLWKQNERRLEFEEMRDSLLAAAGKLDLAVGGRSVDIFAQPFTGRRSVYAFVDRQNLPGTFRTFDFASPDMTQGQRALTSVPQQALYMMNSPFVIEQAKGVAGRVKDADVRKRVETLYRTTLGRDATNDELGMAVKYVTGEEVAVARATAEAEAVAKDSAWEYGFGEYDEATSRLKSFTAFTHFTGVAWQSGETLPAKEAGWGMLTGAGGHAGNDWAHATVRRWVAPRDCVVRVGGMLDHPESHGDGVRARIVTSKDGTLATWTVHHRKANTMITAIEMKKGETIDFVVDCGAGKDFSYDGFGWAVTVTKADRPGEKAGEDAGRVWDGQKEFAGPAAKPMMSAWERLAQVLLESNEFMFVD